MTAVVLVGMSILEANERDGLQRRATAEGASIAFLQHGEPSLVAELTRLADEGETTIRLEAVTLGDRSPTRSWLRRVAGHWQRQAAVRPTILIGDSQVTGNEAVLTSPAWDEVPRHSHQLLVCRGPRCSAQGAEDAATAIELALSDMDLGDDDVLVTQTGCLFPCNNAPVVVLHPDDAWYGEVDADVARRIVIERISWGLPLRENRLQRKKPQV